VLAFAVMRPVVILVSLLVAISVHAQEEITWRSEFGLAQAAAESGDLAAYLDHAARAVELGPDPLGRPFVMYHAARAAALGGDHDAALSMLGRIWDEGIEGPMATIAEEDPAFADTRELPGFVDFMKKVDNLELVVVPVIERVVQIEGAGCNLAAWIGDHEILLVDTGYPRVAASVRNALDAVAEAKPIRTIINTHEHTDHVGGNVLLGDAATIIAHPHARDAASKEQEFVHDFNLAAIPHDGLPQLTTAGSMTIHLDGETVLIHSLPAHTKGDLVVQFVESNVVHMGDNYFPGISSRLFPGAEIDLYFAAMSRVMEGVDEETRVISGHRPIVGGRDLIAAYESSRAIYDFVTLAIAAGESLETTLAKGAEKELPPDWIGYYYNTLSSGQE